MMYEMMNGVTSLGVASAQSSRPRPYFAPRVASAGRLEYVGKTQSGLGQGACVGLLGRQQDSGANVLID
jgi:hypothetical protein